MKISKKTAAVVTTALLLAVGIVGCTSKDSAESDIAASGTCGIYGDNLTWTLDSEGTLTISGEGAMGDWNQPYYVEWDYYSDDIVNVVIEDSVTNIGYYAFYESKNLTSITIPDSVESIAYNAFSFCDSLTSITIPDGVTSIGYGAFSDCGSLTAINVDSENKCYMSEDGVLFNKDKSILVQYPIGKSDNEYVIPDSVTSIGEYAFNSCPALTSITIPDSVTSIGDRAFLECESLSSITIPDSVTSIGDSAFYGCEGLTSITISDSATSIGERAFMRCESLTSITIPDSVTSIGKYALNYCYKLASINVDSNNKYYLSEDGVLFNNDKNILIQYPIGKSAKEYVIPDGVTSVENRAFFGCDSLTSITIPDSVTSIGDSVFNLCDSLTSINVDSNNKYYLSEDGVLFNKDKNILIYYPTGKSVNEYAVPGSVTSIGEYAFNYCPALASITIPDNVTSIGANVFNGTIHGYEGSTAQAYAKKYGIKFMALLSIVKQPKDVCAANGETASVTVKATGEGLTYKWYYKEEDAAEFTYTSSFTGAMYLITMNGAYDGTQLYCVITDMFGNTVKTNTVTLSIK